MVTHWAHRWAIESQRTPDHVSRQRTADKQPAIRRDQSYRNALRNNQPISRDHARSRLVNSRTVESAKKILLHYYLLIYTRRTQGYIRTLIHVSSLVLRLQSYIVTCVYLLLTSDSLLDYNLTTLTNRPILRCRSIRRSTWHRSSIPRKDPVCSKAC